MPKIILENDLIDTHWINSIMFYPNDLKLRQQYFTMQRMDFETNDANDDDVFKIDAKSLKLIISAPSYENFKLKSIEITKEAIVAGDVLASIYLMEKFELPEPSLNKAFFISQEFAKTNKYGDGTAMAVSKRYVKERWAKYKPVAHFWAAWRINQNYPITSQQQIFAEGFESFLQLAKELEIFGLNYVPLRAKPQKPLLEFESTWQLPNEIINKTLNSNRKPLLLIKTLKKYKAPQS